MSSPSVRRGVAAGGDGLKKSCSIDPARRTLSGSPASAAALASTSSRPAARVPIGVDLLLVEVLQRDESGGGRDRVAVERPRVEQAGPGRVAQRQQLRPAADGADREAAADDLPHRRQVRPHAEHLPGRRRWRAAA